MQLKLEVGIYLYGVTPSVLVGSSGRDISIYTSPKIFDKVPLSSLEGYFITHDAHNFSMHHPDNVEGLKPRISFSRDEMQEFAEKHNGEFVPFPRYS